MTMNDEQRVTMKNKHVFVSSIPIFCKKFTLFSRKKFIVYRNILNINKKKIFKKCSSY